MVIGSADLKVCATAGWPVAQVFRPAHFAICSLLFALAYGEKHIANSEQSPDDYRESRPEGLRYNETGDMRNRALPKKKKRRTAGYRAFSGPLLKPMRGLTELGYYEAKFTNRLEICQAKRPGYPGSNTC